MIRQEYTTYDYLEPEPYQTDPDTAPAVLESQGLAIIDTGEHLTPEGLYHIAGQLGPLMLERSTDVRSEAYAGRITTISARNDNSDPYRSLFSSQAMGLHTDYSFSASPHERPAYVVLGCVEAPTGSTGGDTLISPAAPAIATLSERERDWLSESRQYVPDKDGGAASLSENTFMGEHQDRPFLALWDAGRFGDTWDVLTPYGVGRHEVYAALGKIFDTLLDPTNLKAIPWQTGRIAVIDNHRYLHGRSAIRGASGRTLLRAEVLDPVATKELQYQV